MNKKKAGILFVVFSFLLVGYFYLKQRESINEVVNLVVNSKKSYIACGCGCCGGIKPVTQCLYHSKGDSLDKIIQQDKKTKESKQFCSLVGCAIGVTYKYCD